MEHHEHLPGPTEKKQRHIDDVVNPYSVWATPPSYRREARYLAEEPPGCDARPSFRSNAPEVWIRPMQRVVELPPEWIGKGVRGYCIPTVNTEVSYIRNNDPEPWRVNTHEYFHFNYLGGGDGSEGFVHLLEHLRLGDEKHGGYH
jgi:hypothetical protein